MTFQFIIEYMEDDLPYDFGFEDEDYRGLHMKSRRVRAKTPEEAISKFQNDFPDRIVIGWR